MLRISATQIEVFARCKRLWLMQWPWKMPQVPRGSTTFGTVLHGVVERYLRADDLGRGPDGRPVNLYPEGWQTVVQRFGAAQGSTESIDDGQAQVVRKLVAEAIESGILVRLPGRRIEHEFRLDLIPGAVEVTGFIDYLAGNTVIDHKTTKSMRYAKSAEALRKSPQMLVYGMAALHEIERRGEPEPAGVWLQHNVYCTDPMDMRVRKTLTDPPVPPAEIRAYWESLKLVAEEMIALKERFPSPDEWSRTPEPAKASQACNMYGGCAFREICGGRATPKTYRARVESVLSAGQIAAVRPQEEEPRMPMPSLAARIAAKSAAAGTVPPAVAPQAQAQAQAPVSVAAPPAATPAPPAALPPAGAVLPGAAPAPVATSSPHPYVAHPAAAPWAQPGCTAERWPGGVAGWNSKLNPCLICVSRLRKAAADSPDLPEALGEDVVNSYREAFRDAQGIPGPSSEVRDTPAPVAPPAQPDPAPFAPLGVVVQPETTPAAPDVKRVADPAAEAAPVAVVDTSILARAAIAPSPLEVVADVPAESVAAAAFPPKRRGRPPKVQPEVPPPAPEQFEDPQDRAVAESLENMRKAPGRPPVGYTVFLGCVPVRGFPVGATVDLDRAYSTMQDQVVKQYQAEKDAACDSYWLIDPWKRRDAMAQLAERLVEQLGSAYVYSVGNEPDYKAFRDVILRRAGRVVLAVGASI